MSEVSEIIARLGLLPLQPEGGYFKRTWTGQAARNSPGDGTAIYFLLTPETFSAFHQLRADEIWHFYGGDSVEHWQLLPNSLPMRRILGNRILAADHEEPQLVVPANTWQAARTAPHTSRLAQGWSLLGCTLCPGWRDEEFQLGTREGLCALFPESSALIHCLTR